MGSPHGVISNAQSLQHPSSPRPLFHPCLTSPTLPDNPTDLRCTYVLFAHSPLTCPYDLRHRLFPTDLANPRIGGSTTSSLSAASPLKLYRAML